MPMSAAQKRSFVERMRRARGIGASKKTTEIVVRAPTAPAARRTVTYLAPPPPAPKKSISRRIASSAVVVAVQEKELLSALLTAGAIGYLDQEGWLAELPEPESVPIGKKGVLALLSFGAAKWIIKDPELKKIALGITTAAGSIATYEMVKAWTAAKQLEKATGVKLTGDDDSDDEAGV